MHPQLLFWFSACILSTLVLHFFHSSVPSTTGANAQMWRDFIFMSCFPIGAWCVEYFWLLTLHAASRCPTSSAHTSLELHHLGSCLMYRQKVGINLFDRLVWKANQLILRNIKLFLQSLPQGCFNALHYLILLQLLNGFRHLVFHHYKSLVHVGCLLPVCTAVISHLSLWPGLEMSFSFCSFSSLSPSSCFLWRVRLLLWSSVHCPAPPTPGSLPLWALYCSRSIQR